MGNSGPEFTLAGSLSRRRESYRAETLRLVTHSGASVQLTCEPPLPTEIVLTWAVRDADFQHFMNAGPGSPLSPPSLSWTSISPGKFCESTTDRASHFHPRDLGLLLPKHSIFLLRPTESYLREEDSATSPVPNTWQTLSKCQEMNNITHDHSLHSRACLFAQSSWSIVTNRSYSKCAQVLVPKAGCYTYKQLKNVLHWEAVSWPRVAQGFWEQFSMRYLRDTHDIQLGTGF